MCLALDLLGRKECVEYSEFVLVCFGFPRFDSFIHNAKIYNLLARIKRCLPDNLGIKTKNGRIYAQGSWESVCFQRPIGSAALIQRQVQWKSITKKEPPSKSASSERRFRPAVLLAESPGKKVLSRKELEALTGKSRSSASRLISSWIEQGIVKKVGNAKNTKYLVVSSEGMTATAL